MTTDDLLKFEIARELIVEAGGMGTDDEVELIPNACKGHPWDCGSMYKLMQVDCQPE